MKTLEEATTEFLNVTGGYLSNKLILMTEKLYHDGIGDAFHNARAKRIWRKAMPDVVDFLRSAIYDEFLGQDSEE